MKRIVIFDIDNCISNDEWRWFAIKDDKDVENIKEAGGDWHTQKYFNYYQLAGFDQFQNRPFIEKHKEDKIIFITARSALFGSVTQFWLHVHNINYVWLAMRAPNDCRNHVDVKQNLLVEVCKNFSKEDICMAYDDRQEIVDMYRANGLQAEVLKINDWPENEG